MSALLSTVDHDQKPDGGVATPPGVCESMFSSARHPSVSECAAVRAPGIWVVVKDGNLTAAAIFRRHYTYNVKRAQISIFWQRNRNYNLIAGPGEKFVLVTPCGRALFAWRKFRPMNDQAGVNCAVFRNEGAGLSSDLIRAADELAWERWPGERLYTYVDPSKTRHKRDPGRCFLRAGWQHAGWTPKGLRILEHLPHLREQVSSLLTHESPEERQKKELKGRKRHC